MIQIINYLITTINNSAQHFLLTHTILEGIPQGSVLGPLLFNVYVKNLDQNVSSVTFHVNADDIVIFSSASSPLQTIDQLHPAFNAVQNDLKLL